MSNTEATKLPVHAPVPGRGIPTNSVNPQKPYFSILGLFFSAFFIKALAQPFILCFAIQCKNFFIKNKINGIGKILPKTQ